MTVILLFLYLSVGILAVTLAILASRSPLDSKSIRHLAARPVDEFIREREYLEEGGNARFHFFLIMAGLVVAAASQSDDRSWAGFLLVVGGCIAGVLSLSILRSFQKVDACIRLIIDSSSPSAVKSVASLGNLYKFPGSVRTYPVVLSFAVTLWMVLAGSLILVGLHNPPRATIKEVEPSNSVNIVNENKRNCTCPVREEG